MCQYIKMCLYYIHIYVYLCTYSVTCSSICYPAPPSPPPTHPPVEPTPLHVYSEGCDDRCASSITPDECSCPVAIVRCAKGKTEVVGTQCFLEAFRLLRQGGWGGGEGGWGGLGGVSSNIARTPCPLPPPSPKRPRTKNKHTPPPSRMRPVTK